MSTHTYTEDRLVEQPAIRRLLALMQELDHNGLSALLDPLRKR